MKPPTADNLQNLTDGEHKTCNDAPVPRPPEIQPKTPPENGPGFHPKPADPNASQSTIPSKLAPDVLAAIHEALIGPERAAYATIYEDFALREKSISFTAFYNYARPIRLREACQTQVGLSRALAPDTPKLLPDLIASRLLAALVDETVSPRQIQYLVDAYRMACNLDLAHRRLDAQVKDMQRKSKDHELDDLARAIKTLNQSHRREIAKSRPQVVEANVDNEQ